MTKISAATNVTSVADGYEWPVNDGTATAKALAASVHADYIHDKLRYGVRLTLSADETIATATPTEIPWDAAAHEQGSGDLWDVGDPTKIVIPTGYGGIWAIGYNLYWNELAVVAFFLEHRLKVNNTIVASNHMVSLNSASYATTCHYATSRLLSAADYLEVEVQHTRGSDWALESTSPQGCEFWAHLIGKSTS